MKSRLRSTEIMYIIRTKHDKKQKLLSLVNVLNTIFKITVFSDEVIRNLNDWEKTPA